MNVPDSPQFSDPARARRWEQHIDDNADAMTLLDEVTGHAVALRDALYSGSEATSVLQDRSLMLVAVINRLRTVTGLD